MVYVIFLQNQDYLIHKLNTQILLIQAYILMNSQFISQLWTCADKQHTVVVWQADWMLLHPS